ncbi:MAG: hypothetical protein OXR66_03740 [Candidatus Woesearchaeota archaeon]|nr:hypothetical protein [Candidatus Woesearchaeota archaeon]
MKIDHVRIEPHILEKVEKKHGISAAEIVSVLHYDAPIFKKVGGRQLVAIGCAARFVTIFFTLRKRKAQITTAYPSDKKQIKHYKRK